MKSPLVPTLVLILGSSLLPAAENRIYIERKGETTAVLRVAKEAVDGGGWMITATAGDGAPAETQVYTLDSSWATIAWTLHRPGEKTDIRAGRENDVITLTGTFEGKAVQKKFKTGKVPWNQAFQFGLESFAAAGSDAMKFLAIGTSGIAALKIAKFTAEIKATETLRVGEKPERARHVRISLSGLKSALWHGDYWYRETDGVFIRYSGRSGIGAPVSVMDLAERKAEKP
ncbi:MAG: hypothetical protein JW843_11710 [Candidatus Aminicenantes bacterium]|nr:hypothetical protein [Candidatus Aminicenantes bacterium]